MVIGVEQGILLAIALSLMAHVGHSYRPHAAMLVPDEHETWILVPVVPGKVTQQGLVIFRFGADLFYANVLRFADEVRGLVEYAPTPMTWIVIMLLQLPTLTILQPKCWRLDRRARTPWGKTSSSLGLVNT